MTRDGEPGAGGADERTADRRRQAIADAVRAWQTEDDRPGAERLLFALLYPSIRAFLVRRGFSLADAEDLAQETMRRVYINMGDFRDEARFETWVLRIAANVWKNAIRDGRAQKRAAETISLDASTERELPSAASVVVDPGEDAEQRAMRREHAAALRAALEQLPLRMRTCVMHHLRQRSHPEIAALMSISKSTVKSQLKEARQRLRPILERRFGIDALRAVDL